MASVDNHSPVSRLAVVFRAGSRYETADEQGLTHHLRNAVGRDTKNFTGVQLLWQTGSAGANLSATTTRDLFSVEVDVIRDQAYVENFDCLISRFFFFTTKEFVRVYNVDDIVQYLCFCVPSSKFIPNHHYPYYHLSPTISNILHILIIFLSKNIIQ